MRLLPITLIGSTLAASAVLVGCVQKEAGVSFAGVPSSLKVQITGPTGTAKSPLPVGAYGAPFSYATNAGPSFGYATNFYGITISAVDGMGQPIPSTAEMVIP